MIIRLLLQDSRIEVISQIREIPVFKLPNYSQAFARNLSGLSLASSLELENVISTLLDRAEKPDINTQDSNGRTALHHTISRPSYCTKERITSAGPLPRSSCWKAP